MTTTILLILNLAVYLSIASIVTAEEVIRRKVIRNRNLSKAQKKDIEAIEQYDKSKRQQQTKPMLKNQRKLNSRKFRYKLAKHILKAAKKKRFVFNRRYTISDLTTKDSKRVRDLRKISLNEAYADYFDLKSELNGGRKSKKYSKKASQHREKARGISSKYPSEQNNTGFYERTIELPDGETHTDHRTRINAHSQFSMGKFKDYVQKNYSEPKHHRPAIIEMRFNGVNRTSVSSPNSECLEYGRIMLMGEALELATSSEYSDSVFPIRIVEADTKAGKANEGRIKAVEIARYEDADQLKNALAEAVDVFYNKYIKDKQPDEEVITAFYNMFQRGMQGGTQTGPQNGPQNESQTGLIQNR